MFKAKISKFSFFPPLPVNNRRFYVFSKKILSMNNHKEDNFIDMSCMGYGEMKS